MIGLKTLSYQEDDRIAGLTINHPPANVLTNELFYELSNVLDQIEKRRENESNHYECLGKFFSAGPDVKKFIEKRKPNFSD